MEKMVLNPYFILGISRKCIVLICKCFGVKFKRFLVSSNDHKNIV